MTIGGLSRDWNGYATGGTGAQSQPVAQTAAGGVSADARQGAFGADRTNGVEGADQDGTQKGKQAGQNGKKGRFDSFECESCKNRTYQDGSDDPGVSFKSPTKIDADQAATAVMGHEMEHVVRNRAEAVREGREVIAQSVTLHTGICGECGRSYVAGGVTRTVTAGKKNAFDVGKSQQGQDPGAYLNKVA